MKPNVEAGWYELRCPDCHWNHTIQLKGGADRVQCPHCHTYFAVLMLQRLRFFLGGIRQLTAQESQRTDKGVWMQTLRAQANEIERELQQMSEERAA